MSGKILLCSSVFCAVLILNWVPFFAAIHSLFLIKHNCLRISKIALNPYHTWINLVMISVCRLKSFCWQKNCIIFSKYFLRKTLSIDCTKDKEIWVKESKKSWNSATLGSDVIYVSIAKKKTQKDKWISRISKKLLQPLFFILDKNLCI